MRKTTIRLRQEDDVRIAELKDRLPADEDIAAIRYALHHCPLPKVPRSRK